MAGCPDELAQFEITIKIDKNIYTGFTSNPVQNAFFWARADTLQFQSGAGLQMSGGAAQT